MYKRYLEPSSSLLSGKPTKYILKVKENVTHSHRHNYNLLYFTMTLQKIKVIETNRFSLSVGTGSEPNDNRNGFCEFAAEEKTDEVPVVSEDVMEVVVAEEQVAEGEIVEQMDVGEICNDEEPSKFDVIDNEGEECSDTNTYEDDDFFNTITDELIHPNLSCKVSDAMLMILSFFLRHRLTWVALEDMLTLFDALIGTQSRLPKTKYFFQKVFRVDKDETAIFHFYCKNCQLYIDNYENLDNLRKIEEEVTCPNCKTMFSLHKMNDGHFFIHLPIRKQLKQKIIANDILNYDTDSHSECITDLFDGTLYKSLRKKIGDQKLITLTMNTDGVRVFKSKRKSSFWPLQFFINEINPIQRFKVKNILLSGIWYGKDPDFHLYLKPFTDELAELNRNKIKINSGTEWLEITVRGILMSCDTPARCKVLTMKQFNGSFGCTYCLHPGTVEEHSTNNNRKYSVFPKYEYTLRTHEDTLNLMNDFYITGETINGILGVSPLIAIEDFNLIDGTPIEYLHCVLEGVTDLFGQLWFEPSNHFEDYYITPRGKEIINKNIECIKPLKSFTKNPRPLEDKEFWKGNELHKWLLFYGYPCLKGVLKEKYLKHFALLSESIYILLKTSISPTDLKKAEINLKTFVLNFENYYGLNKMVYNVHLLTHLVQCVVKCGPAWVYSNFNFESNNGVLIRNVNGTTDVEHQILSKYMYKNVLNNLKNKSEKAVEYIDEISNTRVRISKKLGEITLLGKSHKQELLPVEQVILAQESVLAYNKFFYLNDIFYSTFYKRAKQTNDSVVCLNDGRLGQIVSIYENAENEVYILLKIIIVEAVPCPNHLKRISQTQVDTYATARADDVKEKCLIINISTESYISVLPNRFESD